MSYYKRDKLNYFLIFRSTNGPMCSSTINFFQGYTGGNRSYKCKFTFPTPLLLQPASHADHILIGHEHFRVVSAKPPHRKMTIPQHLTWLFFKVYILAEIDHSSSNEDMVILGNNRDYNVFGRFHCFCQRNNDTFYRFIHSFSGSSTSCKLLSRQAEYSPHFIQSTKMRCFFGS